MEEKLTEICKEFFKDTYIVCEEAVIEDRVYENISDFLLSIAEVIGYYRDEDE